MTETACKIEIVPLHAPDWVGFKHALLEKHPVWRSETKVYAYLECLEDCCLAYQPLGDIVYGDGVWEGRLFNDSAEVRWVYLQEQGFQGWLTREMAHGKDVTYREAQRYYLNGIYDENKNSQTDGIYAFTEGRFPYKVFEYPLQAQPKEKDRAYILVREYWRAEPDWAALVQIEENQSSEEKEQQRISDIELKLDAPLLVAHRFIAVKAGQEESK